jgi:hypothetical protein
MPMTGQVLDNFTWHANYREAPGSSLFTARVAETLIAILDDSSTFGRRILGWGEGAGPDALALRAIAGFHALARTGEIAELSAVYPPAAASDAHLRAALEAAIEAADPFLTAWLDSPPQTNEVGRSAIILGAVLHLAARFGHPIALYEIGSSAGLNLRLAGYRYELGNGLAWGAPDATVIVGSEWRGSLPPLAAPLTVAGAVGCDVAPLDPSNDRDAGRLISYVWADQFDRLTRIEAALRSASADTIRVERAEAADWVERHFSAPPRPGVTRLLFHTLVWQYLPAATKARITNALEAAGATATDNAPVAWLGVENDGEGRSARVYLRIWPGGESRTIARCDFHGRWVEWG